MESRLSFAVLAATSLEIENEKLRDEVSALRAQLAHANTLALSADRCYSDRSMRMDRSMDFDREHEQEREEKFDKEMACVLTAQTLARDRMDREREREIVQLQQVIIETKMSLAQALGMQWCLYCLIAA